MSLPLALCTTLTQISALVNLGYAAATVRDGTGATRVQAQYALSRSPALAVVSAEPLATGSIAWLCAAASAMILAQAGNLWIGPRIGDRFKTLGPLATALANLAALVWPALAGGGAS